MTHTLFIKNMVCSRCKMVLKAELEKIGLQPLRIDLGEIDLRHEPSIEQLQSLDQALQPLGFERIDDRKSRIIEKIKTNIVSWVQSTEERTAQNLSDQLSETLHLEYSYLSKLFSEVEGITIEQFYIRLRIEKAKELIRYDELSLSEIADRLGYSSVAHLSNQFKKVTGLSPSFFKANPQVKRKSLDTLGD
jgi:AraC-like DNA-binding protein